MAEHGLPENGQALRPQRKIGAVTITFNSGTVLRPFLDSVFAQQNADFILYVVDNDSKDDTLAILAEYNDPRIRLIANKTNVGVAAGNNQGTYAALAEGCQDVLLINNDVEFPQNLFAGLQAACNRLGCDMIVPKIFYHDEPTKIWCAGGKFVPREAYSVIHFGEGEVDCGQYDAPMRIDYSPTCCMLIRDTVFSRIGYMDEKYFVYYDDTDFCMRAMRAGLQLYYDPSVHLTHKVSSLTGGSQSMFTLRYGTRNKTYFIRKHFRAPISWLWLAVYQALFLARLIQGKDTWSIYQFKQKAFREGAAIPLTRAV